MDRGAWRATLHGVAKSQTRLSMQARLLYKKSKPLFPLCFRMIESKQISLGDFGHQCELLGMIKENLSMTTKSGAQISVRIGTLHFWKVCFRPLRFYERSTLVPALANWKKLEEDFQFYEHRWKRKWPFSVSFVERESRYGGSTHLSREARMAPPPSFPGTYIQHLNITPPGLWMCQWASVLCLNSFCVFIGHVILCFISIYFVFPMVIVSSIYIISAYKWFQRSTLLSESRKNLYTGMHMSLSWHYILPSSFIKTFII